MDPRIRDRMGVIDESADGSSSPIDHASHWAALTEFGLNF